MEGNTENLIPGTYLNAMIETDKRSILGLPETAVVRHAGKEYVFISEGNERFTMTEVTTGKTTEGWTEILNSQVILEKELVVKGAYALLMSLKNKSDE
jgi:cobalt-zinc-cadmium efflux system membrane fusion protein